jgi:predicted Zn-dependent protease
LPTLRTIVADDPLPQPAAFHVSAADGWLDLGNAAEARAELAQLSAEHSRHSDALEVWWRVFSDENDWIAALETAETLVQQAPSRASGWIQQSFALHELRRTREAFDRLATVVQRFPDTYVIPYNLACYQSQLGNLDEARRWLKHAVRVSDAATIRAMALTDSDLAALRSEIEKLR